MKARLRSRHRQYTDEMERFFVIFILFFTGRVDVEDAWLVLFAEGVACPAQQGAVVAFRLDAVVDDAGRRRRVERVGRRHVDQFQRRVQLPAEGQPGRRLGVDGARHFDQFVARRTEHALLARPALRSDCVCQ